MKLLTINVTKDKTNELLKLLDKKKEINRVVVLTGLNCDQINIYATQFHTNELLNILDRIGCGVSHGLISVSDVDIIKPIPKEINKKHFSKFGALSTEQIYMTLSSSVGLDIDFILYLIIASIIAGVGLATDNVLMVVASMLLSPLMSPILGITYSTSIKDMKLFIESLKTFIISICVVYSIGIIIGLCFYDLTDKFDWPTNEMTERGDSTALIVGLFISIPSGVGAGISIATGGVNTLVGVAIAASIHPPLINSAIAITYGLSSNDNTITDYRELGGYSLTLFLINVVCIYISALIIFRFKGVKPFRRTSVMWQFPKISNIIKTDEEPENNKIQLSSIDDTLEPQFQLGRFNVHLVNDDSNQKNELVELTQIINTESDNLKTEIKQLNELETDNAIVQVPLERSAKEMKDLLKVHIRETHILKTAVKKHITKVREKKRLNKAKESRIKVKQNIDAILEEYETDK